MQKKYGYVRVSTKEQNEDRQMIALRKAEVPEKNIVVEKMSGADFDRPKYLRLTKRMQPSDVLFIKSIDRLGRNYEEIQEQWRVLTKEKQVDIVVLDTPLLDTRNEQDLVRAPRKGRVERGRTTLKVVTPPASSARSRGFGHLQCR